MQTFFIKKGPKQQFKILFRYKTQLEILVVDTNKKQIAFRQFYNYENLPGALKAFFDTIKQLFEFLKGLKPQTIVFVPPQNKNSIQANSLAKSSNQNFLSAKKCLIQFEIQVANKKVRKPLFLNEYKSHLDQYEYAMLDIQQTQKIQQIKQRILNKKIKRKELKDKIQAIGSEISQIQKQIQTTKEGTQMLKSEKIAQQNQIIKIQQDFKQKNYHYCTKQKNPEVSVNQILDAMPKSYLASNLGKNVIQSDGKKNLFLKNKQIQDSQIQQMKGFNWSQIQILSLGSNKLTNKSIKILGQISDWKNVVQLYLFSNQITDITQIKFLSQLQKLSLYDLELNEASCDFLIKTDFPKLKNLYLNFDQKIIDKCWLKFINSKLKKFPKLESLSVDNPDNLQQETKDKIVKLCNLNRVKLNFGNPNTLQECIIY